MPDQSSAASEHALLQEITAPLATLPDDAVPIAANPDFPMVLRGYDRLAVDAYVKKTSQLVAELQATRSPEAAVRRALERVGEQISGILQRAHDTAAQITHQSRAEAEDRLEAARVQAGEIRAEAERRVKDLDSDTDRIWAERHRIVDDARDLARQLLALAESASDRFPAAEEAQVDPLGGEPIGEVPEGVGEFAPEDDPVAMEEPVGASEWPVAGPEEPVAGSQEPVGGSQDPVGASEEPIGASEWEPESPESHSQQEPAWPQPGPQAEPAWPQPGPQAEPAWPQPGPQAEPAWPQPGPQAEPAWPQPDPEGDPDDTVVMPRVDEPEQTP